MKKITLLVLVAVLTLGVGTAGAQMSLGYQGMIGSVLNGVSLRGWSDAIGYEGTFFYGSAEADAGIGSASADVWALDLQAMYALIQKENSKMYVGLDLAFGGWSIDVTGDPGQSDNIWWIGPVVGAQWSFQGIPELAFNFEVTYDYANIGTDITDPVDIDLNVHGINTTFGIHYAF